MTVKINIPLLYPHLSTREQQFIKTNPRSNVSSLMCSSLAFLKCLGMVNAIQHKWCPPQVMKSYCKCVFLVLIFGYKEFKVILTTCEVFTLTIRQGRSFNFLYFQTIHDLFNAFRNSESLWYQHCLMQSHSYDYISPWQHRQGFCCVANFKG